MITIALAIAERWPPQNIIFLYWCQNVVIGAFACLRLLAAKNIDFAEQDVVPAKARQATKLVGVTILAISFFAAHAFILKELAVFADMASVDAPATVRAVRAAVGLFFINQCASFILNYRRDSVTPTTYKKIYNNTFVLMLPLMLWIPFFAAVVILTVFVLYAAYFAGANENILQAVSDTLTSGLPAVALVLFMVPKAFFDTVAHLASYSETGSKDVVDA